MWSKHMHANLTWTAEEMCRVHRVEGFISRQPDLNQEPLDIEDLLRLGQVFAQMTAALGQGISFVLCCDSIMSSHVQHDIHDGDRHYRLGNEAVAYRYPALAYI